MTEIPFTAAAALTPDRLAASPVHQPGSRLRWTTANVDEGLPGIVTPLTWSMYFPPTEATARDCWVDLGVLPERERPVPDDVDGRFISVAYGHAIANVDLMGQMAAGVPGGSAASMEEQLFGSVQGGGQPQLTRLRKMKRYPMVLAKSPRTLRRAMRDLEPRARATTAWWEQAVFAPERPSDQAAVRLLVEARRRFEGILSTHMVLSMAAQGVMGQVEALAAKAGLDGLQHELIKSVEGTAEFELVRDLWLLSADRLDLEQFLRRHGYHGPREGLVESMAWREHSAPVLDLVASYRSREAAEDIDELVLRRRGQHQSAVHRLEGALGPVRSVPARALVRFAAHVPNWRETGRATMLRCIDVARFASRIVGAELVNTGVLSDPTEVCFLTIDELATPGKGDLSDLAAQRRQDHAVFATLSLPHVWFGVPPVTGASATAAECAAEVRGLTRVTGLGVSTGVAEGEVRVVRDLDDAAIDEGMVMVCKATDPSWASLFPLAEAVVTDTGSAMSHAAIVCRELGLPCVAGTRTGTRDLRDGMRVRVDGGAGVVEILARPSPLNLEDEVRQ